MTKNVQNNISLIAGLFFLAQSVMAPAASAAALLADGQPTYFQAATSADPVIFNSQGSTDFFGDRVVENYNAGLTIGAVLEQIRASASADRVIDNSEPTVQEIKDYVLGEIKKAGLNVSQANALIYCESRWDYQAVNKLNRNGTNDKGLWQINSIHKDISDAEKLDYKASTKWAIAKRLADGNWSAWSCASKRVAATPAADVPAWE